MFNRFFRVIPAEQYLAEFSSDRRHMRRPDGTWIKPPPPYPPIQSSGELKEKLQNLYFNMHPFWNSNDEKLTLKYASILF